MFDGTKTPKPQKPGNPLPENLMRLLLSTAVLVVGLGCQTADHPEYIQSNCVMNGTGSGSCSFTNTGSAAASVCGKIRVTRVLPQVDSKSSSTFCSGRVDQRSTIKVDFFVSIDGFCGQPWNDNCSFDFYPDTPRR
jgi:hypothetical protein